LKRPPGVVRGPLCRMARQLRRTAALGILGASLATVGGCAAPAVMPPDEHVATRMHAIAIRYLTDQQQGMQQGMKGFIPDISRCYAAAIRPVVLVYDLRDCLILDAVVYYQDRTAGGSFARGSLYFFEPQSMATRWGTFGPLAGFSSASQLIQYLRDSNNLVRCDVAEMKSGR